MPIVSRTNLASKTKGRPAPVHAPLAQRRVFTLPTTKSAPIDDINRYIGFMHGEPGIGKTTSLMQEEDTLLISFDRVEDLEILQVFCPNWLAFEDCTTALAQAAKTGSLSYRRVVVDGVDIAYKLSQIFTEEKMRVEDVSDVKYGKGWHQLKKRFGTAMNQLFGLASVGCGVWFISHSTEMEIENADKSKTTLVKPYMAKECERVVLGRAHFALYYHRTRGQERVLTIRGSKELFAKCNAGFRFLTPDNQQVFEIPAGNDPTETWQNLVSAFNNEQTFTHVRPAAASRPAARLPVGNGGFQLGRRRA